MNTVYFRDTNMQLTAKKAKRRVYKRSVADEVCRDFIAQTVTDPNMVQPGQVLVDQTGNEMQVVENDPTKQDVVMAPAGDQVPEGTTSIPNMELNTYTVKNEESVTDGVTYASIER